MTNNNNKVIDWLVSRSDCKALGYTRSYTLNIPDMPVMVYGGDEKLVYRRTWSVPFPDNKLITLYKVQSFIGLDRGDIVEADVEVSTLEGVRYYLRSVHKECMALYDAWDSEDVSMSSRGIVVTVVGRINGTNMDPEHPRFGELNARIHYGVVLLGYDENEETK